VPAANQIELHPFLPQQEIVDFCEGKRIHVTAYSPLGSTGSPLFQEEGVLEVAKKHKVGPGTVLLSYHCKFFLNCLYGKPSLNLALVVARGCSVLAKSVTPSRIDENMKLISLDADDMATLENISKTKGLKRFVYPDFGVNLGFPDKQ